jgi:hypothetical protein
VLFAAFIAVFLLAEQSGGDVGMVLLVCFGAAFLGVLCAAVWNFIQKRWAKGLVNLFVFLLCGTVFAVLSFLTELFFSNAFFTIYEGDWGKPYAARFEVWFIPDSGAPEWKLLERVFKIEGWQR